MSVRGCISQKWPWQHCQLYMLFQNLVTPHLEEVQSLPLELGYNCVAASTIRMRGSDAVWFLGPCTKWPYNFSLGCALLGCLPLETGHHAVRNPNLTHGSMVSSTFRVVQTSPLSNSTTFLSSPKETLDHSLPSFSLPWQPLICVFFCLHGFVYSRHFM